MEIKQALVRASNFPVSSGPSVGGAQQGWQGRRTAANAAAGKSA